MNVRRTPCTLVACLLFSTPFAFCQEDTAVQTEPLQSSASQTSEHAAKAEEAGLNPEVVVQLDRVLQVAVDEKNLSGIVAMIERNGVVGYHETFGLGDISSEQPMQSDTILRIYSMTKPIVAVAAMSLWEEGAFTLDEPISKHLPEWETPKIRVKDELVDATVSITPRHLMTHTTGITKGEVSRRPHLLSLDSFSRTLAQQPLASEPGTRYRYGYSIDILGRYLEVIEGKSLDVILRERVLDPLGMTDTEFWIEDTDDLERTAQLYTRTEQGALKLVQSKKLLMRKPKAMLGGQGLVSTTDDYARFCRMMANGGTADEITVLKPETVALMMKNHLKEIGGTYGLGGWGDGSGLYYWGGYAGTKFWISTPEKAFAIYMVQRSRYEPPTGKVFQRLSRQALQD
jgi:CubicO group peptidase (beta-lactamase class C family)